MYRHLFILHWIPGGPQCCIGGVLSGWAPMSNPVIQLHVLTWYYIQGGPQSCIGWVPSGWAPIGRLCMPQSLYKYKDLWSLSSIRSCDYIPGNLLPLNTFEPIPSSCYTMIAGDIYTLYCGQAWLMAVEAKLCRGRGPSGWAPMNKTLHSTYTSALV